MAQTVPAMPATPPTHPRDPGTAPTPAAAAQERELCATARLLPAHLLALKAGLLRAAAGRDHLAREDAADLFRLEPCQALRVYDLAAAAGWLRAAPPPEAERAPVLELTFADARAATAAAAPNGGCALAHAGSGVQGPLPAP